MKQIKKLLVMLLVFVVAVSMVSAAAFAAEGSFEVQAVNVSGEAGKEVVMTVKVNSNPGVVAAILDIAYDSSKLTLNSVTDVKFINDATEYNIANGICTVVLDNALANSNVTNTGDLLKLNFTVKEGVNSDVNVDLTVKEAVNYDLASVSVNAVNGKVTVGGNDATIDTSKAPETLPAENISIEGNTMTINPVSTQSGQTVTAPACVVLIKNGDSYTKVAATKNGDKYDFDVSALNGGQIVVAVKGDINGDGILSALEARQILMAANNSYSLDGLGKALGDLDGNGILSALEARKVLMAANNSFTITW